VDLEAFELVLLRRPEDATAYPEEELARIQQEHLAYHAGLREAGLVVTNGPVIDGPDPSLHGLTFYRAGSLRVRLPAGGGQRRRVRRQGARDRYPAKHP
jgi:uncharacterized protein